MEERETRIRFLTPVEVLRFYGFSFTVFQLYFLFGDAFSHPVGGRRMGGGGDLMAFGNFVSRRSP